MLLTCNGMGTLSQTGRGLGVTLWVKNRSLALPRLATNRDAKANDQGTYTTGLGPVLKPALTLGGRFRERVWGLVCGCFAGSPWSSLFVLEFS